MRIAIVANSVVSARSMGGGDKLFIELAKSWAGLGHEVVLFGSRESQSISKLGGWEPLFVEVTRGGKEKSGLVRIYLKRIIQALRAKFPSGLGESDVIYSASEALPDLILSLVLRKSQKNKAWWIVGFYLKAPNPLNGEVPLSFKNLIQFGQQQLGLRLMKIFKVDGLLVLSRADEDYSKDRGFTKVYRVSGGIDSRLIDKVLDQDKIYEACFLGRLTAQKGIADLLPIWQKVLEQKPTAKLAVIGWGEGEEAQRFLRDLDPGSDGLRSGILNLGFLENEEKIKVLKSSRILIFPSYYESFGIVVLEALACGVPVVAYDLPVLRDNFSGRIVVSALGNKEEMARKILSLLDDEGEQARFSSAGREFSKQFEWGRIGQRAWEFIERL